MGELSASDDGQVSGAGLVRFVSDANRSSTCEKRRGHGFVAAVWIEERGIEIGGWYCGTVPV